MSGHRIGRVDARANGLRIYLDRTKGNVDDHNCIMVPWAWTDRLSGASDEARAAFTIEGAPAYSGKASENGSTSTC